MLHNYPEQHRPSADWSEVSLCVQMRLSYFSSRSWIPPHLGFLPADTAVTAWDLYVWMCLLCIKGPKRLIYFKETSQKGSKPSVLTKSKRKKKSGQAAQMKYKYSSPPRKKASLHPQSFISLSHLYLHSLRSSSNKKQQSTWFTSLAMPSQHAPNGFSQHSWRRMSPTTRYMCPTSWPANIK